MKNSVDYYEEITTHDSSLSKCIFSIMYARTQNYEKAYEYFDEQVKMDVENTLSNTHHGLHVANMGGTYLTIVSGFLGLRTNNGLSLRPYLPEAWPGYEVNLIYRGVNLHIQVSDHLKIQSDAPIDLLVYGKHYKIQTEKVITLK
jgi:alpha,alpha-trehalose phosphorylase